MSMVPTLAAHYGDEALFRTLDAAKKVPNTETMATKLQMEQIQSWLASKKSPGKVFDVFGLDKLGDSVLSTPLFKTWLNYQKKFKVKNPSTKPNVFLTLSRHYGDNQIDKMVKTAMDSPKTKKIAKLVQTEKMKHSLDSTTTPTNAFYVWILNKPGADDAIRLARTPSGEKLYQVKIDKVPDTLLASSDFKFWMRYLNKFNKKLPREGTNTMDTLRVYYTDEALAYFQARGTRSGRV